jgi:preprotein translocase subunit YajC
MNSNVSQVIDGAGPITGLFVLLLGVAVFFIWRSLNKQMKKVDA